MKNYISSKDNSIYKLCQKLSKKKYRDKENKYIIEGYNLVKEALAGDADIDLIISREDVEDFLNLTAKSGKSIATYAMETRLFSKLSDTESSQGVLAVVNKPDYSANQIKKIFSEGNLVILDRLQDPGNIGTIIRTTEGAGYGGVCVVRGTVDVYSPKVVRASAGSLFRIPIIYIETEEKVIELMRKFNKRTVVSCLRDSHNYYEVDLSNDIALIIGNEGKGCSDYFIKNSDVRVSIPMEGRLESLNAAVAAGILMYESARKK